MTRRQRHAEVANTVGTRQKPSQNAGVRAIGDRAGRECLGETNTLLCKQVEPGSLNAIVSVTVNVIGAERIDRNEENVGTGTLLLIRRMAVTRACCQQAAKECKDPHRAESITAAEHGIDN